MPFFSQDEQTAEQAEYTCAEIFPKVKLSSASIAWIVKVQK